MPLGCMFRVGVLELDGRMCSLGHLVAWGDIVPDYDIELVSYLVVFRAHLISLQ